MKPGLHNPPSKEAPLWKRQILKYFKRFLKGAEEKASSADYRWRQLLAPHLPASNCSTQPCRESPLVYSSTALLLYTSLQSPLVYLSTALCILYLSTDLLQQSALLAFLYSIIQFLSIFLLLFTQFIQTTFNNIQTPLAIFALALIVQCEL